MRESDLSSLLVDDSMVSLTSKQSSGKIKLNKCVQSEDNFVSSMSLNSANESDDSEDLLDVDLDKMLRPKIVIKGAIRNIKDKN